MSVFSNTVLELSLSISSASTILHNMLKNYIFCSVIMVNNGLNIVNNVMDIVAMINCMERVN